jgi:hypothetical protein
MIASMRRGTPIALVMALALFLASQAQAGSAPDPRPGDKLLGKQGGIAYVSDSETIASTVFSTQALTACPNAGGAWQITGGGLALKGQPADLSIAVTRPADLASFFEVQDDLLPDDYWEATGRGPVGTKETSYAICAKQPKLSYVTATTPNSATSQRTATDSCPGQSTPTGGGGFIATTGSYISSMYPTGQNWSVSLFDQIGGAGGMSTNFVCLKSKHLSTVVAKGKFASGAADSETAKCPKGSHVTGGGAKLNRAPGEGVLNSSYPADLGDKDKVPDDGWTAIGQNNSGQSMRLAAYAICMS